MIKRIFLGPFLHWVLLACVVGLCWVAGSDRFHVSNFNPFLLVLIGVTLVALILVFATSKPGTKVTREPIEED